MTSSELRKEILETSNPDWFNKECRLNTINTYSSADNLIYGFVPIFQFFETQFAAYQKLDSEVPNVIKNSKNRIESIINTLNDFFYNNKNHDSNSLNNVWNNVRKKIRGILDDTNSPLFYYDSPETTFLIQLHKSYPNSVGFAVAFLVNLNLGNMNRDHYIGILQAYEFKLNDGSGILKRRKKESTNVDQLRSQFQNFINEGESQLVAFLGSSKKKTETDAEEITTFLGQKKDEFDKWYEKATGDEKKFNESRHKRISELEELYKEKLKLEAPAKYWSDRAKKLNNEGKKWLIGLIVCSGVAIVGLGIVLYFISDGTLKELFDKTGSAIRWSIVFITFVSFLAYGIRTFAKLTFSAYHLVRDAEEREQLVYVYLALINESKEKVDSTERHLIMQSLFSRADTGLLKDDASPTMPGNIVDKFMAR